MPRSCPNKHWGLDLAYNFDAIQQNTILCFEGSVAPPGLDSPAWATLLMETYGVYQTHTQYGYFALTLTPIERVTIACGIQHRGQPGHHDIIQPAAAAGAAWPRRISRRWRRSMSLLHKNVTFKAGWNYYQYGEGFLCRAYRSPLLPCQQHDSGPEVRVLICPKTTRPATDRGPKRRDEEITQTMPEGGRSSAVAESAPSRCFEPARKLHAGPGLACAPLACKSPDARAETSSIPCGG